MAGDDGAHAAWLLAQHADQDPAFQRRCLELIKEAVKSGEAARSELAYLTDRVLLAEGKPQEYGTQMTGRKGGWVPRNLRDPETVDDRRAAMSLESLGENVARMARQYGPPKPTILTCDECGSGIEVWPPDESETQDIRCASCGWATMILDREPLLVRPDRSRPPADVIADPEAERDRDAVGGWALRVYRPEPS